jgi:putative transposase
VDEELKKAAYLGLNLVVLKTRFPQEYATMQEVTTTTFRFPSTSRDALTSILRQGAQEMLAAAIEAEVAEWIETHRHLVDERGHRQVVRNGHLPEREITTGLGPLQVRQPRVHDRRGSEEREVFSSKILPPYLRKTKSLEEL